MAEQTVRLTMAQAVVRFLANQRVRRDGVEQAFFAGMWGIFGHGNVAGLGQALEELSDELRYYRPQNEQGMVHAAIAYAKMKNRLQTFACTSSIGPGATNMITGAATATVNRLPVLLLPGDVFASRRPDPVLQQLEHPLSLDVSVNDAFRPVSRFWDRIERPEQLLASLPEAMRVLTDQAETGAVTVCLPQDVQTEAYDYPAAFFAPKTHEIYRPAPAPEALAQAVALLRSAQRPVIVCGGGVIYSEATAALADVADGLGIPVVETQAGKGALPWNHPWNAGPVGSNGGLAANRLAREADLVIAVGTRLSDFVTASHTAFANPEVTVPLAQRFLPRRPQVRRPAARRRCPGRPPGAARRGEGCRVQHGAGLRRRRRDAEGGVGCDGRRPAPGRDAPAPVAGERDRDRQRRPRAARRGRLRRRQPAGRPAQAVAAGRPQELPPGVRLLLHGLRDRRRPGREDGRPFAGVVVMVGDGSYLMLHTEIVTALQEGVKLLVVVVDNGGYQCIKGLQEGCGSPSFGNELRFRDPSTGRLDGPYVPIDFAKNAESLGALALRATTETELRRALEQAKAADRTVVIDLKVDPSRTVPGFESWWDVPVAEVSGRAGVREARASWEAEAGRGALVRLARRLCAGCRVSRRRGGAVP
jgi:3D-(3,5/4)-trihydroxycyclohexane-1,2-dione acylhydrolase (decyclizing)